MNRFVIEDPFWEVFNDARIGIVLCKGLDNTSTDTGVYEAMLREAEQQALKFVGHEVPSENPVIREWREAYQRFKTKKGARSSIEALLSRVKKGNALGTINPLVDIYNSISLRFGLPCGGEDIDTFAGTVRLTKAAGTEAFVTLGTDENSPPYEGEVVYKDDLGAICRCWNWRESVRTMLTAKTRNAFLCLELVDGARLAELQAALAELARLVQKHCGGSCTIHILDVDHRELELS
ncbi:MAG: B3/4 domain-containing protein [Spirochaetia bacterium]|jgi:DNA/RNA-binding domain of Phe-tRNA-synthetase-like protein|nr:B3/4 domain-containing protein [Spirochaetia bacterium]